MCALLPALQGASSFNQPLHFDTSKVTNMVAMFSVRSARAFHRRPTISIKRTHSDAPPPCLLHALTPPPPHAATSAADYT